MDKDAYLYKRGGVYYARIRDPLTGDYLSARSTGKGNEKDAARIAEEWTNAGAVPPRVKKASPRTIRDALDLSAVLRAVKGLDITAAEAGKIGAILQARGLFVSYTVAGQPGAVLFEKYLLDFWDYKKSKYIHELIADGKRASKEHCIHCQGRARAYWVPYFKGKRLSEITADDLRDFKTSLANPEKPLAAATRNRILFVGVAALRYAYKRKKIDINPTLGIGMVAVQKKERGVLSVSEAVSLFTTIQWKDERARAASLIAASTGLRISEVRALRVGDVEGEALRVAHAYTDADGFKATTKTGKTRLVPVAAGAVEVLLRLVASDPNKKKGIFIFWNVPDNTKPASYAILRGGLDDALDRLYAGKDTLNKDERATARAYWKERGVGFHSWRHYYSARMADRLDARTVMLATGHHSEAVFQGYANHMKGDEQEKVRVASNDAFGGLFRIEENAGRGEVASDA